MKKYKLLPTIIVMVLITMGAVPTSVSSQSQTVIAYALPYDFTEYSIYTQDSYATAQWTSAIYASVVKRSAEAGRDYVADLAAALPTTYDGKAWTFSIRDGAKFSSGNPVTADDIIFSFKVAVSPAINLAGYASASLFLTNESAVKNSDGSVTVTLTQEYAFPMSILGQPIIEKAVFGERYNDCITGTANACNWDANDGSDAVSAGPFMMDRIDMINNTVTLKKNPNYYGPVKADKLIFKVYSDFYEAKSALSAGNVHIVNPQYFAGLSGYEGLDNVTTEKVSDRVHQEISLNHQSPYYGTGLMTPKGKANAADAPAAALSVRRAMSAVANRELYSSQFLEGLGSPAASTMPSAAIGWDSTLKADTYDVERAKSLMEDAGYDFSTLTDSDGDGKYEDFFFSITVLAPNTNAARNKWSDHWQQELPKIGIGVNSYENVGWDVIVPRTFGYEDGSVTTTQYPVPLWDDGGYDVLFVSYTWRLDWDPTGLYEESSFVPTGGNFYNYVNKTTEDLISRYITETNVVQRNAYAKQIQKAIHDDLPVIPLVYPESLWGFSDKLQGMDALLLSVSAPEWDQVNLMPSQSDSTLTGENTNNDTIVVRIPRSFAVLGVVVLSLLGLIGVIYLKRKTSNKGAAIDNSNQRDKNIKLSATPKKSSILACSHCGTKCDLGDSFCANCGSKLR